MNNQELAKKCLELIGGSSNVKEVYHCATRLRITLVSQDALDVEGIKNTPEILKLMIVGSQTQLVIGPHVAAVCTEMNQLLRKEGHTAAPQEDAPKVQEKKTGKKLVSAFFNTCSSIFTPLVPVFTASGMVKAVLAIMLAFGMSRDTREYEIINFMSDTIFYFMPIFLAISSANIFGCDKFLAGAVGAIFVYPTYVSMVTADEAVTFFGLPLTLYNYASSAVPAILTILFMSYVEKFADRIIPKLLKVIFVPMLTFAVTAVAGLFVIGPVGAVLGDGFMVVIMYIYDHFSSLLGMLIGAFSPFIVFVGMHHGLGPLATMQLSTLGYESISGPGEMASNIAQGAATLVLSFKTKDDKLKTLAFAAGTSALCGITEPALYGFSFKYKKALFSAMAGGGAGGLYIGITKVVRFARAIPGIPSLPVFIDMNNPMNLVNAVIGCVIAFAVTFIVAWVIIKPEDVVEKL